MSKTLANPSWALTVVATIADVLGILGFLGLQANTVLRIAVAGAFALLAIILSGYCLAVEVALLLSPRGSYFPRSYHARALGVGGLALAAGVALGVFAITTTINAINTVPVAS